MKGKNQIEPRITLKYNHILGVSIPLVSINPSIPYTSITDNLIQINPILFDERAIERQYHINKHPRIFRYWNWGISDRLDQDTLERTIRESHLKNRVHIINKRNGLILYHYPRKPPIYIDQFQGKFYVDKTTLKKHGLRTCQHQTAIILEVLRRKLKLTKYKKKSVTINTNSMGKTEEELNETFTALKELLHK
jgi:hypothetical protein